MITGFTPNDVANPLKSIIETLHALQDRNCATHPISIVHEEKEWAVYLDVRCSRDLTFDIRVASPSLAEALRKAFIQLRRNL